MTTLDLSPGSWRHGVMPALRVELRQVHAEAPNAEALAKRPAQPAKAAKRPLPEEPREGIAASTAQSGSTLPLTPRYYRNSEVDLPATPVERAPLLIPELPFHSKLQGAVKARVFINEDGTVESVKIIEAKPVGGVFEEAALEALRRVRYKPAEIAGQAVKTQKLIEVSFNPNEEQAPEAK